MDFLLRPGRQNVKFAVRTLIAGLTAYLAASALGLKEPQWSLLTVYIVAQPLSGLVLAKSLARLAGTASGALIALGAIQVASGDPVVMAALLVPWLAACTYLASLLRGFRAYGFVLAGYTAAIVGLPGTLMGAGATAYAVARCSEIGLGIACAAAATLLLAPQSLGASLSERLTGALREVIEYAAWVLREPHTEPEFQQRRRSLIQSVLALDTLRSQALFDSGSARAANRAVRRLIHDLLRTLSAAVTIHDQRVRGLCPGDEAMLAELGGELRDIPAELDGQALRARTLELRRGILEGSWSPETADPVERQIVLGKVSALLTRIGEAAGLEWAIRNGVARRELQPATPMPTDLDHASARRNALRAALAFAVALAAWIATGLQVLILLCILVAVVCSLFAMRDNPIAAASQFLAGATVAAVAAFAARFFVLTLGGGLLLLLTITAIPLLIAGLTMARPALAGRGTAFAIFYSALLLGPEDVLTRVPGFLAASGALVGGVAMSMGTFALIAPPHSRSRKARLIAALREDAARAADDDDVGAIALEARMYDRINQLAALLDLTSGRDLAIIQGTAATLSDAIELLGLRGLLAQARLPPATNRRIQVARQRFAQAERAGPGDACGRTAAKARRALARAERALGGCTPQRDWALRCRIAASLRLLRRSLASESNLVNHGA